MKFITLIVPFLFMTPSLEGEYDYKITRVIDGDTIAFEATFLPFPLKQELSLRVYGVDTPEKGFRSQCDNESELGKLASKYVQNLVKISTDTKIIIMQWDKYGGRVLGDVLLDNKSLRSLLIENGFAREYFGAKKSSWCKE